MRRDELPRLCEFIVNLYGVREMDWLPEIPKCLVSGHLSLSYYSRGTVGKGGKNEKLIFFCACCILHTVLGMFIYVICGFQRCLICCFPKHSLS